MIKLLVDEGYAFDYLAILFIKKDLSDTAKLSWEKCSNYIRNQLGYRLFTSIIESEEYKNIIEANKKTYDAVALAKEDKCTAQHVDKCNYERYIAKINLQKKFFNNDVTEVKVGYEKYSNQSSKV